MRKPLTNAFSAVLLTLAMTAALLAVLVYESPIRAAAATPVTFMGAGDIAACGDWSEPNAIANGDLIREASPDAVFALGDNAYDDGSSQQYNDCYDPAWGSFKAKTYPVPGNHEYHTANAQGYLDYFGTGKVKNATDGGTYYAVDLGNNWRYYALNSEVSMSAGSAQETWLKNDLAAHPGMHFIGGWHRPRYSQGMHGNSTSPCPLWNDLMAAKADIVLVGHDHLYQRFAKMDCNATAKADGIRQFLVGSGGNQTYALGTSTPGAQFSDDKTFGVLKLNLYPDSYDWQFISSGRQFSSSNGGVNVGNKGAVLDSGSAATNVDGVTPTSTSSPTPTSTSTSTSTPTSPATGTTTTVETRVAASSDDAESRGTSTDLASTDLELTTDGSTNQTVANRFAGLAVPKGATITNAYVQFTVDEATSGTGSDVTIKAEDADNAATYTTAATSITGRATTGSVAWSPDAWGTVGTFQRTPNIASLVQAVVNRPGWASGNALALQFSGTGTRTAESIDGTAAPMLHVEYSTGSTTSSTPTPTTSSTPATSPSPTSTPADPSFPTSRDKYQWPFTSDSIWNMPIGSGAQYVDAGLTNLGTPTQPDEEYIGVDPADPLKNLTSRDEGDLGQVHVPGNISWDGRWNGSTAFLAADDDHVWQGQPLTLGQGGNPSWNDTFPHIDPSTRQWQDTAWQYSLSQDDGIYGAHGGSHLSAIGGTIREGELVGTTPIRHALKINVYGAKFLFDAGCGGFCGGFRWPAATSDDYGSNDNNYGTQQPQLGNPNPAMKMGALLALPPTFDVSTLQTAQARKIAQALKDYGAYITDDSASNNYAFAVEYDALDEWRGGDGWYPALSPDDPAVQADLNSLYPRMKVVDNNSPTSVGGGGTPRQPLAPPFAGDTPSNQAPNLSAGTDATITLPDVAALDGTVNDDGLPTGSTVTQQWSKVSGPGTVSFGNAKAVDTSASFSTGGSYVLRLTATDGAASSSDDVTITVNSAVPSDTAPPDTTLESASCSGPTATFTFSSSEAGSTFQWRLNSGTWFATTVNSQSFDDLSPGSYTFEVRAIDQAGNVDPTPASHTWKVRRARAQR